MCASRAKRVCDGLCVDTPFYTMRDFIEAVAALSSLYWDEIDRTSYAGGKKLYRILWCATSPVRLQWLFNNTRLRRQVDKSHLSLLGSGTSSNESLHAELNRWMRNLPELYISTLELQLSVNALAKLLCHNCSMYSPQYRQHRESTVLAAIAGGFAIPVLAWDEFCLSAVGADGLTRQASLPQFEKRKRMEKETRVWSQLRKKPASAARVLKRTPNTLKRKSASPLGPVAAPSKAASSSFNI